MGRKTDATVTGQGIFKNGTYEMVNYLNKFRIWSIFIAHFVDDNCSIIIRNFEYYVGMLMFLVKLIVCLLAACINFYA